MDEMKPTEKNEYQFIRETIVGKRKNRIKNPLFLACGVIVMAVAFGVISRFCFVASEPFVNKLLGISPTPVPTQPVRNHVALPSSQEQPTPTQSMVMPPATTGEPSRVDIAQGEPVGNGQETEIGTEILPSKSPEAGYSAGIGDYIAIHQELRRVATNAASAMAMITVTTERTDWFEQVYEESKVISGVIVGDNNVELLILTEASPLMTADSVKITIGDYTTSDTVLYMSDVHYNLAVIGIDYASIPAQSLEKINYAVFGESHSLFIGTPVIAIGNPNGYTGSFEIGTVTARNSYAYVVDNRLDLFNTSIPDYEDGTGVIINTNGEVIGLITHTFKEGINQNLNTAIGISRMKPVIEQLVNGNRIKYFGVIAEELTESMREQINSKIGVRVTDVITGSPAELAGIRKDDIILIVENTPINNATELRAFLDACEDGDEVSVTMLRKGPRAYSEVETTVIVRDKSIPLSAR